MHQPQSRQPEHSVLAALRDLLPAGPLATWRARQITELQAHLLRRLLSVSGASFDEQLLATLPHVRIEYQRMPISGCSLWEDGFWVIRLNHDEPRVRQRFTCLHEYHHIVTHGHAEQLFQGDALRSASAQVEQLADYFAACVLMPRSLVTTAWTNGLQTPRAIAAHFDVSSRAAEVRLQQLGLLPPVSRHGSGHSVGEAA